MQAFLLLALIPAVFCASILQRAHKCDRFCIALYDPVCGTDGKTYSNSCYLSIAHCKDPSVSLAYKGPCNEGTTEDPCSKNVCLAVYDPVCGTDNKTYGNECYLKVENCKTGVTVAHYGPCEDDFIFSYRMPK